VVSHQARVTQQIPDGHGLPDLVYSQDDDQDGGGVEDSDDDDSNELTPDTYQQIRYRYSLAIISRYRYLQVGSESANIHMGYRYGGGVHVPPSAHTLRTPLMR